MRHCATPLLARMLSLGYPVFMVWRRLHGLAALLPAAALVSACGAGIPTEPSRSETPASSALVTVGPNSAPEPPAPGPAPSALSLEDEVLVHINQRRSTGAMCGATAMPPAAPLQPNEQLRNAARKHSEDMAAQGFFSHTSLDGRSYVERILSAGYSGGPYGETIAGGQGSPAAAVGAWMTSASHCQVIMNNSFRAAGAGYAYRDGSPHGRYWTLTFGGR